MKSVHEGDKLKYSMRDLLLVGVPPSLPIWGPFYSGAKDPWEYLMISVARPEALIRLSAMVFSKVRSLGVPATTLLRMLC